MKASFSDSNWRWQIHSQINRSATDQYIDPDLVKTPAILDPKVLRIHEKKDLKLHIKRAFNPAALFWSYIIQSDTALWITQTSAWWETGAGHLSSTSQACWQHAQTSSSYFATSSPPTAVLMRPSCQLHGRLEPSLIAGLRLRLGE